MKIHKDHSADKIKNENAFSPNHSSQKSELLSFASFDLSSYVQSDIRSLVDLQKARCRFNKCQILKKINHRSFKILPKLKQSPEFKPNFTINSIKSPERDKANRFLHTRLNSNCESIQSLQNTKKKQNDFSLTPQIVKCFNEKNPNLAKSDHDNKDDVQIKAPIILVKKKRVRTMKPMMFKFIF